MAIVTSIFTAILNAAGMSLVDSAGDLSAFFFAVANLANLVVNWLYYTLLESSEWQATLGKRALSMSVTDLNGNRISWGRANGRYWGKIISALILFIGFIMAAFTDKKQALHDKMAGTLVLNKN